jgi:hypothetical protein
MYTFSPMYQRLLSDLFLDVSDVLRLSINIAEVVFRLSSTYQTRDLFMNESKDVFIPFHQRRRGRCIINFIIGHIQTFLSMYRRPCSNLFLRCINVLSRHQRPNQTFSSMYSTSGRIQTLTSVYQGPYSVMCATYQRSYFDLFIYGFCSFNKIF